MIDQAKRLRIALICLVLVLSTLAVFWPVMSCDFVNFDDNVYVTENHQVRAGLSWPGVAWAFGSFVSGNWHPLTMLSHMLDCQVYGMNPAGHHLTNLIFHLANTGLLFLVLRRLTGAVWRSAFVAALFALHPLHVESVAWISERKDVLSTFFFMLTLLSYSRYAQGSVRCQVSRGAPERANAAAAGVRTDAIRDTQHTPLFYCLALLFFALGLMSKVMLVTLPFVLLLLDFWPLQRFQFPSWRQPTLKRPSGAGRGPAVTFFRLVWEKFPFFVLTVAASVMAIWSQSSAGAMSSLGAIPAHIRLTNALVSYMRYLGKTIWPENLAIFYPYPQAFPAFQTILALMIVGGATVLAIALWRRAPYVAMGWFWFVGILVPVIGLAQAGSHAMADRFTYVSLIGVFVAIVWGLANLTTAIPFGRITLATVATGLLAAYGWMTREQVKSWRDSAQLFEHALAVAPPSDVAHDHLGLALLGRRQLDEAKAHFEAAVKLKPKSPISHCNLGIVLGRQGKFDEAIGHFREALKYAPGSLEAHYNWGYALLQQGKTEEAEAHFSAALQADPSHALAHYNLGNILLGRGELDEAAKHFAVALQSQPDLAGAHNGLGVVLARQKKVDEAQAQFQRALELGTESAEANHNLGNLFNQRGRMGEAVAHYREALKLQPDLLEVLNNLGWILATSKEAKWRNAAEAMQLAARAIALTRTNDPGALDTLAAACAEAGQFEDAVRNLQHAIELAETAGVKDSVAEYRRRLKLYQSGKPYRE
jgi:protein O-mannosyl-transferase